MAKHSLFRFERMYIKMDVLALYLGVVAVMSFICLGAFAFDKFLAKRDIDKRVPEVVLLSLIAFGGSLGGFIGRNIIRHKTNNVTKFHFPVVLYTSLLLQTATVFVILGVLR